MSVDRRSKCALVNMLFVLTRSRPINWPNASDVADAFQGWMTVIHGQGVFGGGAAPPPLVSSLRRPLTEMGERGLNSKIRAHCGMRLRPGYVGY